MTKNAINAVETIKLDTAQQAEKAELETAVQNWQSGFFAAGEALAILKSMVPQGGWKAYLTENFDLTEQKAIRLVDAFSVVQKLKTIGVKQLPSNEAQAFSMKYLLTDEAKLKATWESVLEMGGRPTMDKINQVLGAATKGTSVGGVRTYLATVEKSLVKKLDGVDMSALNEKQRADLIESITKIEIAMSILRSKVEVATKQAA